MKLCLLQSKSITAATFHHALNSPVQRSAVSPSYLVKSKLCQIACVNGNIIELEFVQRQADDRLTPNDEVTNTRIPDLKQRQRVQHQIGRSLLISEPPFKDLRDLARIQMARNELDDYLWIHSARQCLGIVM